MTLCNGSCVRTGEVYWNAAVGGGQYSARKRVSCNRHVVDGDCIDLCQGYGRVAVNQVVERQVGLPCAKVGHDQRVADETLNCSGCNGCKSADHVSCECRLTIRGNIGRIGADANNTNRNELLIV